MGPLGIGLGLAGRRGRAAAFDFAGALPAGATLTRASAGTRWTAAGVLANEAADVARFDHHPVTGVPRGLLIEPAATNLTPYATDASNVGWQAIDTVKTGGQGDPLGGTGAGQFAGNGGNVSHGLATPFTAVTAGTTYTLSQLVKPVGGTTRIQLYGRANSFDAAALANFLLTGAGSVTATVACSAAIEAVAGGWYRISCTAAANATVSDSRAALWLIAGGSDGRNPGFVSSDVFLITGAQIEAGATASSLIVTGAAAASRAADTVTLNWASRGVADGVATIRYSFDDGSSQDRATTVSGGTASVPTDLNRRWLRRAEKI